MCQLTVAKRATPFQKCYSEWAISQKGFRQNRKSFNKNHLKCKAISFVVTKKIENWNLWFSKWSNVTTDPSSIRHKPIEKRLLNLVQVKHVSSILSSQLNSRFFNTWMNPPSSILIEIYSECFICPPSPSCRFVEASYYFRRHWNVIVIIIT